MGTPSHSRAENYDKKVSFCSNTLSFSEPEKNKVLIKTSAMSAYDGGADMIVTPCPVCQMNVEVPPVVQDQVKMPVVHYSTLMSVAYGKNGNNSWRIKHRN